MGSRGFDLEGKVFGGLVVIDRYGKAPSGDILWNYLCHCKEIKQATASALRSGRTKSCGCMRDKFISDANSTHGLSDTPLYARWKGMHRRCDSPNNHKFERYGGRGIKVCDEWSVYENFHQWALENGYKESLTIDRIDNDGDYEPGNCRWANHKQQARNRSDNRWITFDGHKKILSDWSKLVGLGHKTITSRLDRGWSVEKALTTSTKKYKATTKSELIELLTN